MDFSFTQDQRDFQEAVQDFLAGECTPVHLRKMVEKSETFSEDRWQKMIELGLMSVRIPEPMFGLGLADIDFILLAEACGYAALPEPLIQSAAVAVPLLVEVGGQEDILAEIADGRLCAVVQSQHDKVTPRPDMDFILISSDEDGIYIARNPIEYVVAESIDPLRNIAQMSSGGHRIATGNKAVSIWHEAERRLSVMQAAELIGLSCRMVDMAVEYAKDRQQFGKPIGCFQAIKHHLASVMVQIDFCRPLLYRAADSLGRKSMGKEQKSVHTCHAKLKAGECATLAAETAHQVHGAMGYTYEVDLHLWMKRAWALNGASGDGSFHEQRLSEYLLGGNAPVGPGETFMITEK